MRSLGGPVKKIQHVKKKKKKKKKQTGKPCWKMKGMECVEQKHRSKRRRGGSKEDGFAIILFSLFALVYILFSLWNLEHFRDGYYSLTFLQHPLIPPKSMLR